MLAGVLLLTLLATTSGFSMRAAPGPDCWYKDKVCDISSDKRVGEPVATGTALDCHTRCVAETKCEFFRWSETKYEATCVLLRACGDGGCSGPCTSGPKDCASLPEPCPKLDPTNAEDGKVTWDCGATFNPYNSPIPVGMTCTASCPAWKDANDKLVSVSYTCVEGDVAGEPGTWGPQTLTPPGPIIDGPNIQDPSKSTDCGAKCLEYPLWYDPNRERGAKFYCDPPLDLSTAATKPVNLPQDGECFLFCDNLLVADIFCNNNHWTDISQDPQEGISCFGPVPTKP